MSASLHRSNMTVCTLESRDFLSVAEREHDYLAMGVGTAWIVGPRLGADRCVVGRFGWGRAALGGWTQLYVELDE